MNSLDAVLVLLGVLAVTVGYQLGFVRRAASWIGMFLGIAAGMAVLPPIVARLGVDAGQTTQFLLVSGVVVLSAWIGQTIGYLVGGRVQRLIPRGVLRRLDAGVGAVTGLAGLAVLVWLVMPVVAEIPSWPADLSRGSAIVRAIDRYAPPGPEQQARLRSLLGEGYPEVFSSLIPAPELGPPPKASGLSVRTAEGVADSTVKVSGEACGQEIEGSGFVVGPGLVATNAHVIAGDRAIRVTPRNGRELPAVPVAFDPARDLAILQVDGLDRRPLGISDVSVGGRGGVFGHPEGGPLRVAPFEVGRRITARGFDIYGEGEVSRDVLILASSLRHGDSGSALVDPTGSVVGVAFAIAPDDPGVAYALRTDELRAVLATVGSAPVGTGRCLS